MRQALFIQGYGVFLGYSNGNIVVCRKELASEEFTAKSILYVVLQGEGVSISNAAMIACADKRYGAGIQSADRCGLTNAVY